MTKFHINGKGETGSCNAKTKCPFGGVSGLENHFSTEQEARAFYESSQINNTNTGFKKVDKKVVNKTDPKLLGKLKKLVDNPGSGEMPNVPAYNKKDLMMIERLIAGKNISDKVLDDYIQRNSMYVHYHQGDTLPEKSKYQTDEVYNNHIEKLKNVNKSFSIIKKIREDRGTSSTLPNIRTFDPEINTIFSSSRAREKPSIMEYQMNPLEQNISRKLFEVLKKEKAGEKVSVNTKNGMLEDMATLEAMKKEYDYSFAKAAENLRNSTNLNKNNFKQHIGFGEEGGSFDYSSPKNYSNWSEIYPEIKDVPLKLKKLK